MPNVEHYKTVFIDGNADYAIPAGAISSEERLHKLPASYSPQPEIGTFVQED